MQCRLLPSIDSSHSVVLLGHQPFAQKVTIVVSKHINDRNHRELRRLTLIHPHWHLYAELYGADIKLHMQFCHPLTLTRCKLSRFIHSLKEGKNILILYSQYHCSWWPVAKKEPRQVQPWYWTRYSAISVSISERRSTMAFVGVDLGGFRPIYPPLMHPYKYIPLSSLIAHEYVLNALSARCSSNPACP